MVKFGVRDRAGADLLCRLCRRSCVSATSCRFAAAYGLVPGRRAQPAAGDCPGGDGDHVRARYRRAGFAAGDRSDAARSSSSASCCGIAYNTKEFLLPPLLLAGIYGYLGCLATPPRGHPELRGPMNATSLLCVAGRRVVLLAFAMVLGIHVALRTQNSQLAIIHTLSTIFFLSVGTLVCIALILINGQFEYQWGASCSSWWRGSAGCGGC